MKTSPSNPLGRVTRYLLVFLLLLAVGGRPATAQQAPATASQRQTYQVGTIAIKFIGTAIVSEDVVRANIQVREGGEMDGTIIDRDIRALYRTGLFELIEVKQEAAAGDVVNLVFEVTPKFRVLAIRYEGNSRVKSKRLEKEVKTKPNTSLDERQVKEDSEKIREYYQKTGYNQISVNYTIERDRATGFGTVVFKIKEGAKVKIVAVRFEGNEHVKSRALRKEMETKKWWFMSWLTDSGRFKDDKFDDDLDKLRDYYREQGYLDVDIPQDKISFDYPTPGKLILTIRVTEGVRYKIGDISITGSKIHEAALLKRILRQRSGMVFAPSKLDKDAERMEDFYGSGGYLETRVRLLRKPNVATGNIDLEYQISESEKYNVESILIEGNSKTKSIVILRELVLGPGEVFDTVRMKISKLTLDNTRFFDDVNIAPQETNIPGRRNLRVAVKEARTGNLTFGAGFSSVEQATVFAELSQSNFDLFNRRSLFQGDGQKFRLRLQLGSLSSEAVLSFEEPWLFERRLALGFSLYRTASDYNSDYYTQVQTGFEVYLRKRLFELVEGKLSYNFEQVSITNVDPAYLPYVAGGDNTVSRVAFQLLRDTRDKIINTTSGNRMELNTEVAGGALGGTFDFYKIEFKGAQYYPLFDFQAQVLSVLARGGVIDNYGSSRDVPYFYKYYLGGPYSLRGYEYNGISPRDPTVGILLGGKTYAMLSLEYSADIVSPIRFAVFYDAGFVNAKAYDFNPADYHDNFGVGIRLFVAGAPLSLDYGVPLKGDPRNKSGNKFNFSFGTRF
ncbi:MAG: outer membrane protein assembly factor BamA [Opitutaceae bacterium]|nr:outer membrane protein assembly factor BamA [Opitutaceae bacterium]